MYRWYTQECLELAKRFTSPEIRSLFTMAQAWHRMAQEDEERVSVLA